MTWKRSEAEETIWGLLLRFGEQTLSMRAPNTRDDWAAPADKTAKHSATFSSLWLVSSQKHNISNILMISRGVWRPEFPAM